MLALHLGTVLLALAAAAMAGSSSRSSRSISSSSPVAAQTAPITVYPNPFAHPTTGTPEQPLVMRPSPRFRVSAAAVSASHARGPWQPLFVYAVNNTRRAQQAYAGPGNRSSAWTGLAFAPSASWPAVDIMVEVIDPNDAGNSVRRDTRNTPTVLTPSCVLRPLSLNLRCVRANATAVWFRVAQAMAKISVEVAVPAAEQAALPHSLMVFVDPPETEAPRQGDPGVVYFAPGIHFVPGGVLRLNASIRSVYLAAGAYVVGGVQPNASLDVAVSVSGRGAFSGETFVFHDPRFPSALVTLPNMPGQLLSGVTIVDPPKYHMRSYGAGLRISNVKLVAGWTYNTDGLVGGNNSVLEDCFLRCNDDTLKIYSPGMVVRRMVVWQGVNGAVLQTGWWTEINRQDIVVDGLDLIHAEWLGTGQAHASPNNAILDNDPRSIGSYTHFAMRNITVRNIRVEVPELLAVVSIRMLANATGFVRDLTLANISLPAGGSMAYNRIESASSVDTANIRIDNLRIGSRCLDSAAAANLTLAHTSNFSITCPPLLLDV